MIRLYRKYQGDRYYYDKNTNQFTKATLFATEFQTINEINDIAKNSIYDNLLDLYLEHVVFVIRVKEHLKLSNVFTDRKDAEELCKVLNEGLKETIFKVVEHVSHTQQYNKEA